MMIQSSTSRINKVIVTEWKKAILSFFGCYIIGFILILVHRYQTLQYYNSQAALAAEQAQQVESFMMEDTARKKVKTIKKIVQINPLQKYKDPVQNLSNEVSKALESVHVHNDKILEYIEKLQAIEQNNLLTQDLLLPSIPTYEEINALKEEEEESEPNVESALNYWRRLISIGSLREIPFDDLDESFLNVTNEIKAVLNSPDEETFTKQLMFDASPDDAVTKEKSFFICPSISDFDNTDSDNNSKIKSEKNQDLSENEYAHESDLQGCLDEFETIFGNRVQGQGIHALQPASIEQLENEMESKIKIILEDIFDVVDALGKKVEKDVHDTSSVSSKVSSCIDAKLIATLIDAGMNALTANGDLREKLRQTILQLDPGTLEEELILDADLPLIDESPAKTLRNDLMRSINIRSKIDTSLLLKSVDWIDSLFDSVSGYNDELDQYFDYLTSYYKTNSIGEIVVENILEHATRVGDINFEKYLL